MTPPRNRPGDQHGALRRAVTIPALVLTAALAVLAVLVAVQTGATQTAAVATTTLERAVADASAAAGVAGTPVQDRPVGSPCTWFGAGFTPATGQVRPGLDLAAPLPADPAAALDAVAARLGGAGWSVERSGGVLDATADGGYRLSVDTGAGQLRLTGQAPCVWPDGERRPAG